MNVFAALNVIKHAEKRLFLKYVMWILLWVLVAIDANAGLCLILQV